MPPLHSPASYQPRTAASLTHVQPDKKTPVWYSIITNAPGYVCSESSMEENETKFLTKYVKPRCELRKASTKARRCDGGKARCDSSSGELSGSQYATAIIWYIRSRASKCGSCLVAIRCNVKIKQDLLRATYKNIKHWIGLTKICVRKHLIKKIKQEKTQQPWI